MKSLVPDVMNQQLSIATALQEIVTELEPNLTSLIEENRLTAISGIGGAIAAQIKELHRTGTSRMLEQLRTELPRGALELSTVPGLCNVAELREACEQEKVTSSTTLQAGRK